MSWWGHKAYLVPTSPSCFKCGALPWLDLPHWIIRSFTMLHTHFHVSWTRRKPYILLLYCDLENSPYFLLIILTILLTWLQTQYLMHSKQIKHLWINIMRSANNLHCCSKCYNFHLYSPRDFSYSQTVSCFANTCNHFHLDRHLSNYSSTFWRIVVQHHIKTNIYKVEDLSRWLFGVPSFFRISCC